MKKINNDKKYYRPVDNLTAIKNYDGWQKEIQQYYAGKKYKVEIIDTWDMTVPPVAGIFETAPVENYRLYDKEGKKIRLPAKPYLALRITEICK